MFADFLGDHRGEVALLVSAFGCGDNSIVFGRKERADDRPNERSNIVGDDDQNVFEFRGSNSRYMNLLLQDTGGRFVEMTENYRSSKNVVDFANTFVKGIKDRMKSIPIISMSLDDGFVAVVHHNSEYMYEPLVNDLTTHRRSGTTCVLTRTNEQAAILVALLRKRGVNSKLIQSLDGFRLINMAEVRHFLKYISGCI